MVPREDGPTNAVRSTCTALWMFRMAEQALLENVESASEIRAPAALMPQPWLSVKLAPVTSTSPPETTMDAE